MSLQASRRLKWWQSCCRSYSVRLWPSWQWLAIVSRDRRWSPWRHLGGVVLHHRHAGPLALRNPTGSASGVTPSPRCPAIRARTTTSPPLFSTLTPLDGTKPIPFCVSAIALDSTYATAWTNLAAIDIQRGQYEEARALLERTLAINPQDVVATERLGTVLLKLGDSQQAIPRLEKVVASFPTDDALAALAQALRRRRAQGGRGSSPPPSACAQPAANGRRRVRWRAPRRPGTTRRGDRLSRSGRARRGNRAVVRPDESHGGATRARRRSNERRHPRRRASERRREGLYSDWAGDDSSPKTFPPRTAICLARFN